MYSTAILPLSHWQCSTPPSSGPNTFKSARGLLVAIPALVAYHFFRSRIDNYVQSIDNLVVDLVEGGTK